MSSSQSSRLGPDGFNERLVQMHLAQKILVLCVLVGLAAPVTLSLPENGDCESSLSSLILRPQTPLQKALEYLHIPSAWAGQFISNSKGIAAVVDRVVLRPMPGGLFPSDHPWATGTNPKTGKPIWPDNVLFSTPRDETLRTKQGKPIESDDTIVTSVGNYMAGMARKSASDSQNPFGSEGRMPHAINYIHGAVHYNAGILVFNDFKEAIYYLTDPKFVDELKRFAHESGRELMIVFRNKEYDRTEYANFIGVIRSKLPWFSNSNGPPTTKTPREGEEENPYLVDGKVLWGNPAPYATVNPITGNWIADVSAVGRSEHDPSVLGDIARPPIEKGKYFQERYQGTRTEANPVEKLLVDLTARRLHARGDKGNLFFVDQRKFPHAKNFARYPEPEYISLQPDEKTQVAIIGAGAAGLALARELRAKGLDVLVLEQGDVAGNTWAHMPTHLKLLTPWGQNELPESPVAIRPPKGNTTALQYAKYLQNYARYHAIPIANKTEVTSIQPNEGGGFLLTTSEGKQVQADRLVSAAGYYSSPVTPEFPGQKESSIPQIHAKHYRDPLQISQMTGGIAGKRVLVIGKGLSAGQIANELDKAGFQTSLSVRGPIEFGASPNASRIGMALLPFIERGKLLLGIDSNTNIPMQGGRVRQRVESGAIETVPEIQEFQGREVVFAGGTHQSFDAVVYATGFKPSTNHLGSLVSIDLQTGAPPTKGGESIEQPGLYFLGMDGLINFRSRFLRGIREDAETVAEDIVRGIPSK